MLEARHGSITPSGDILVDNFGVSLETTALVFSAALIATFAVWYLGFGTTFTSFIFLAGITGLVFYITLSRCGEEGTAEAAINAEGHVTPALRTVPAGRFEE